MKIFEFVNRDTELTKIKELIYYEDDQWKFPKYNIKKYLDIVFEREVPNYFFELSDKIVEELNNKNIYIEDFDNKFYYIVENILKKKQLK